MKPRDFVPDAGDLVWLEFDPQAGHEQGGLRPAAVLSPASYNAKSGLMVCCPLTSKVKGYPFEVAVDVDGTAGAILADQLKSLDWRARKARRWSVLPAAVMVEMRAKVRALLGKG